MRSVPVLAIPIIVTIFILSGLLYIPAIRQEFSNGLVLIPLILSTIYILNTISSSLIILLYIGTRYLVSIKLLISLILDSLNSLPGVVIIPYLYRTIANFQYSISFGLKKIYIIYIFKIGLLYGLPYLLRTGILIGATPLYISILFKGIGNLKYSFLGKPKLYDPVGYIE